MLQNDKLKFLHNPHIAYLNINSLRNNVIDLGDKSSYKFLGIINKHAPLKKKIVRGNNAPFMNKEFQKEIYVRSRLRNKFWVEPSAENKTAYKKQRNKGVKIRRKVLRDIWIKFRKRVLKLTKVFGILLNPS